MIQYCYPSYRRGEATIDTRIPHHAPDQYRTPVQCRQNAGFPFCIHNLAHALREGGGRYAMPAHWHEELEIIYAGDEGLIIIDAEAFRFHRGDILFVNRECLHQLELSSTGDVFVLLFDYGLLDFRYADVCQTRIVDPLKGRRLLFPTTLDPGSAVFNPVRALLEEAVDLFYGNVVGREMKIKCVLYELLYVFFNAGAFVAGRESCEPLPAVRYVQSAISYMEAHMTSTIRIEDLSGSVGLNPYYFIKLFRQITGMTPIVYLRELRIRHSALLLMDGLSVTQAALMSGFNNLSYYDKCFKRKYGVTPKLFAVAHPQMP